MSPKWISIKVKVALVVCLASGVAFGLFFSKNYQDTIRRIHSHSEQLIARNHQGHSRYIQRTLEGMRQDSEAIIGFPPIQGILRSRDRTDQIDPLDGSSLVEWRHRLETLFVSLIGSRQGYSQIRLILARNNWQELTRVDKVDGEVKVTPWQELQEKGTEPYIQRLIHSTSPELQFSNVTRNREHGQIAGPATIRSMRGLLDASGALIGAVVVNAHIAELLTLPETVGQIGHTYYAIENTVSEGLNLPPEDLRFVIKGLHAPDFGPTDFLTGLQEDHLISLDDETGLYVTYIRPTGAEPPFAIRVVTRVDMHELFAAARSELWHNVTNAALLTLLASLLGYVFIARLLRPLQSLVKEIADRPLAAGPLRTRFPGHDEVAVIGQSLTRLTNSLIHETKRLDMILSTVAEGILTLHEDGRVEDLNPAAVRILGLPEAEVVGHSFFAILGCPDLRSLDQIPQSDGPVDYRRELSTTRRDGTTVALEIHLRHASYEQGNRLVVMLQDITARTKAMERSEALIAALKKSNAELDQFAYVASHDLKAPLRVISNAVTWLEEDLEPYLNDDTRESMNLLHNRASRMERLLNDLLQHSRIGRVADPDTRVSGEEMAEDLLALLEVPEGMSVRFSETFLAATLRKLPLETVLVNLIGNGIKHHDRSEGLITVDLQETGDTLTFTVTDDGPGIEPQYHDRIFEVFQTLQSRDQLESSGMGLAFVKKHIDVVGGSIRVISDGRRGTTFEVRWPATLSQQTQAA